MCDQDGDKEELTVDHSLLAQVTKEEMRDSDGAAHRGRGTGSEVVVGWLIESTARPRWTVN